MSHDAIKRSAYHAGEAERLPARRLGLIDKIVAAGVHATLAVNHSNRLRA